MYITIASKVKGKAPTGVERSVTQDLSIHVIDFLLFLINVVNQVSTRSLPL